MQIGIDVSRTAESKTGLGSYACSLLDGMAAVDQQTDFLLYPFVWDCFPADYHLAHCPPARNFRRARRFVPRKWVRRLWESGKIDQRILLGGDPDVFYSPLHNVPQRNFRRLVCMFHDVSFRAHPEFSTEANRIHCETNFARARLVSDHLITCSHYSKQEMVEKMGVPASWVTVIHEAADPRYREIPDCPFPDRVREAIGAPDRTILYVGSVEPRKNLATLVRAFATIHQRGRVRPTLIIAGGSGWMNSDVYAEIEKRGLADRIHFTGFVTDQELLQLYNAADVFCFPTIYEGFGLPVIEAMSCGTPVVTSRVASIPEVGGDAVLYNDEPRDDANLARLLEEALTDRERAADLRARGLAQAARFSWEKCARETIDCLQWVANDPRFSREQVVMDTDERGIESGFHGLEHEGDRAYRWAEPESILRLTPLQADAWFEAEIAGAFPAGQQTLAIRGNGHLIGAVAVQPGWATVRIPVPAAIPRGTGVEVSLRVNYELTPAMKGGDPRRLGIRVARAGFSPVRHVFPGS